MNIRQIISEAIDQTLLAKYSQKMGMYLGNYGLDMTPLGGEEGKKIIQSLNNIDSTIANKYQGGKKNEESY